MEVRKAKRVRTTGLPGGVEQSAQQRWSGGGGQDCAPQGPSTISSIHPPARGSAVELFLRCSRGSGRAASGRRLLAASPAATRGEQTNREELQACISNVGWSERASVLCSDQELEYGSTCPLAASISACLPS